MRAPLRGMPHAGRACPWASGSILLLSRQNRGMTRPGGQTTAKNGPPIVPCDGAEKNFAIAKHGAKRSRLGAGANMCRTIRAPRVRKTTMTAWSNRIAIGCRGIATANPTSDNGAPGPARMSSARVIAIESIGFATVTPMNRSRNSFRPAMRRTNVIAIAANDRANGSRATNQNGVRATRIESSQAPTLRRAAIATAASTMTKG